MAHKASSCPFYDIMVQNSNNGLMTEIIGETYHTKDCNFAIFQLFELFASHIRKQGVSKIIV